MTIDPKYYTPELEEFHVGFEFQYNNGKWEDFEIKTQSDLIHFTADFECCRVKYLDREDIELQGWRYYEPSRPNGIRLFFLMNFSEPKGEYTECSVCYSLNTHWMLVTCYGNGVEPVSRFSGRIKNISEFRILMKWLDIKKGNDAATGTKD